MFASLAMVLRPGTDRDLRTVLNLTRTMADAWGVESVWPLDIPTACGGVVRIRGPEDFPLRDLPCPCPHPGCWAILWVDAESLPPGMAEAFGLDDEPWV